MKFECIKRCRKQYPVSMMCRALKVSRCGFYAWLTRPTSAREQSNQRLIDLIKDVHSSSRGVYGAPRICEELKAHGYRYGKNRIAKLMRIQGIKGCPRRRVRRSLQDTPTYPFAENLLRQDFMATRPNVLWASDITYIQTRQGILYLAVVMDLFSRKIVGWAMDSHMSRHLAISALNMALDMRNPPGGLIHHSDRGAQYASDDYRQLLEQHDIECSMSARGNCYDNAVVESFFGSLKRERIRKYRYQTRAEAQRDIFDYIECFYNRKRRHGYLGFVSPTEFESQALSVN